MKYKIRFLFAAAYLLAFVLFYPYRWKVLGLLPVEPTLPFYPLYRVVMEVFYGFLALFGAYAITQFFPARWRIYKGFVKCGFHNADHEYPMLLSMRKGKEKPYEVVYRFKSCGLSLPEWDKHLADLEAVLNAKIYYFDYGKRSDKTVLVHAIPWKHFKPTLISSSDNAFGSASVESLINLLVVGATGTGKTVAIKVLLHKIAAHVPNAVFTILDFKQQDFAEFAGLPGYYGYADCVQGLEDFYASFKVQQATGKAGAPHYLVIDEWGAFILSQEKKQQAEKLKTELAELLMLGRSYNYRVICGLQRGDSSHFVSGARDQFRAILALGNLSKEQKQMLFPDFKEQMNDRNSLGEGYLFLDGKGIEHIKIERVQNFNALGETIRQAMSRGQPGGSGGEAERKPPDTL